jgi:hypothetical protein
VRALPVTRHGVQRTFADFWSAPVGAPDAAAEEADAAHAGSSSGSSSGEEEEDDDAAVAARAQSDGWAAQLAAAADAPAQHADAARMLLPYVTLGVVGEPNMGKSAVINRLFRAPVVKVRAVRVVRDRAP